MAKKIKQFNKITILLDTGLQTLTAITEGVSIAAFASFTGLPVGIALRGTSLLFSAGITTTQKIFTIITIKQEKHEVIKLPAQSKLDSIADIISQAMQDGDISFNVFHKVLKEVGKYRKIKADIRN